MGTSQRVSRGFHRLRLASGTFGVVALIIPTLLLAQEQDKSAVLANCKLKAMELYKPSGELAQFTPASEYVVTCMIAAGYRIDPLKKIACHGWPTIDECFIPR